MNRLKKEYLEFITEDKYISRSDLNSFLYAKKDEIKKESQLFETFKCINEIVERHNQNYLNLKLIEEEEYFDKIFQANTLILDEEQRKAIITDDDYNLIIAGAGSGKTTTMVAKIKYLVDKKKARPEEILVFSYTNKAVLELKERLCDNFKLNPVVTTFHKFGYNILKKNKLSIEKESIDIIKKIYISFLLDNEKSKLYITAYSKYYHVFKINPKKKNIEKIINEIVNEKKTSRHYRFFIMCKKMMNEINVLYAVQKNKRNGALLEFVLELTKTYQLEKKQKSKIDFNDMITNSIKELKKLDYKYIIIDEYQDISIDRLNLVKEIKRITKAKVIAVGDDWQTIFSFAGSNIELFTKFSEVMGYSKELKITNTYRNSQELIDVAGNFIMKNNRQIKKKLYSSKHIDKPVIIYEYNKKNYTKVIDTILIELEKQYGDKQKILLLGRYKFDVDKLLMTKDFIIKEGKVVSLKKPNLDLTFLTVHTSKGLGFDNVIILNAEQGRYGFPSEIKEDKIFYNKKGSSNNLDEERRLFYVALTRSKNKVYILAPSIPSSFVLELKNHFSVKYIRFNG